MLSYGSGEHFTRWNQSTVWLLIFYCFSASQTVTSGAIVQVLQMWSTPRFSRIKGQWERILHLFFFQAKFQERLFSWKWVGLCALWKLSTAALMSTLTCKEENHIRVFLSHCVNWHKYELSVNIVVIAAWPNDCAAHLQSGQNIQSRELCFTPLDNKRCW